MKIFGIDPGSERTGYGCIEALGSRHHLVICGSVSAPARSTFPDKLKYIHAALTALLDRHRPDCVAVENIFHARNVRSALKLGHARGIALLAASEAGLAGRRVLASGDQARRRRLWPGGEAPGPADGDPASRSRGAAIALRRVGRARRGDLSRALRDRHCRGASGDRQTAHRVAKLERLSPVKS